MECFFGMGAVTRAIEQCRRVIHPMRVEGSGAVGLTMAGLLIKRSIRGNRDDAVFRGDNITLQFDLVASLASHPKTLPILEIRRFWLDARFGSFPNHVYEVWLHRKIVAPFVLFVMVLLSVPLVQRYQRQANLISILVSGLAIGFSFIVLDDLLLTFGEAGLIPPILAAWAATLIFAAIGATLALHRESH